MRVIWKPGDIVLLQVRDGLFTACEMANTRWYLFFYNYFFDGESNIPQRIDPADRLFCVGVVGVLQEMGLKKLKYGKDQEIGQRRLNIPELWIKPKITPDGFRGGRLIKCDPPKGPEPTDRTVRHDLNANDDLELIRQHELTNAVDAKTLRARLEACFHAGRNVDLLKAQVFGLSVDAIDQRS